MRTGNEDIVTRQGLLTAGITGVCVGICTHKITKEKQKKAGKNHVPYGPYEALFKRPLDFILSGSAIVVLSPVLLAIALLVKRNLGSPVFFTQERPGKDEKIFVMRKYRTMLDSRGSDGELLSDEERLTEFGRKLRNTSLDELPELFNIIRGDMSIIGPRPLLVEYLPRYNERQSHRHDVRPGLTGLAQVSGRNELLWNEKFEDDLKYIEKITFLGDLKILIKTISTVIKHQGINADEKTTMPKFMGNKSLAEQRDVYPKPAV